MPATNIHRTLASQTGWLNTSRALTADDLAGRILLIDFWTFCCINCMHVIPDLEYLEKKFGDDLTVIGVHSAKFKNERDTENIRSAILRYGIHHPVVNDFDFSIWQKFGVRAWPTFVLINPKGTVEAIYSGEGNREEAERDIAGLIKKYAGQFTKEKLPITLEETKAPPTLLSFPGKLWGASEAPLLFASDSGHHQIVQLMLNDSGGVISRIGAGTEGFKDGAFATAQFHSPQGVLYDAANRLLYVADTENHALRVIDFNTRTVATLAGTGKQGYERAANRRPAPEVALASPWDLAFYPDNKHIVIAMAGTHQLWSYDIAEKTVSVIAGNGRESIDDGRYPFNSLSQPSGLSVHDGRLYFVDSETSSLRVYDGKEITTLIGTGLFDFGYKDGKEGEALMQHAIGVFADDSGVYVADSYNHSIRRYDPKTGQLSTFAGHGQRGGIDGPASAASFNEPNDLVKIGGKFYVADTNNHAIRVIENGKVSTLALTEETGGAEFSEQLPNLQATSPLAVSPRGGKVSIGLASGWKINDEAPSALMLFDAGKKPVAGFTLEAIKTQELALPPLQPGATYHLQGTLYYCEAKEGAQCLIKSFSTPLTATDGGQPVIELKLN